MRVFGTDPDNFLKELQSLGYKFYDTDNFRHGKFKPEAVTISELLGRTEGNRSTNVWAEKEI